MEEERRLMYVGITRAKEKIYLLFTTERNIYGSIQSNSPSRFLDDIPEHLLQTMRPRPKFDGTLFVGTGFKPAPTSKSINVTNYRDGQRIQHPVFGNGIIVSAKGDVLTIAFSKVGLKKLSASIAPLKKI